MEWACAMNGKPQTNKNNMESTKQKRTRMTQAYLDEQNNTNNDQEMDTGPRLKQWGN